MNKEMKILELDITKILEENSYCYGLYNSDDYLEILENYNEAKDSFNTYLESIEEENTIEDKIYYYNDYLKYMDITLTKLKYFKNKIDTNPSSLIDENDYYYNNGLDEHLYESLYAFAEEIIIDMKLKSSIRQIFNELEESTDWEYKIDESKLSKDSLIVGKELGWINGKFIVSMNQCYLEHWTMCLIDTINYSIIEKYIEEIEIYLNNNQPLDLDYDIAA